MYASERKSSVTLKKARIQGGVGARSFPENPVLERGAVKSSDTRRCLDEHTVESRLIEVQSETRCVRTSSWSHIGT